MKVGQVELEKKYHDAVEHWRRHWMPDYDSLLSSWERYFPKDEPFCLCAKLEIGTPDTVSIGDHQGEKKRLKPDELTEEEAKHLLAIIRAQASTEFGSIQQHSGTLERAQDDEDRFWVLREAAFHLAAGVIPLRRWAKRAAEGDVFITMPAIQKSIDKWFPRALEMFGDERGGDTNVKYGFKDMKNREAQDQYIDEVQRM